MEYYFQPSPSCLPLCRTSWQNHEDHELCQHFQTHHLKLYILYSWINKINPPRSALSWITEHVCEDPGKKNLTVKSNYTRTNWTSTTKVLNYSVLKRGGSSWVVHMKKHHIYTQDLMFNMSFFPARILTL